MSTKPLLITLAATLGVVLLPHAAQAFNLVGTSDGNDCPSGGFQNCEYDGSPTIIKFEVNKADASERLSVGDRNSIWTTVSATGEEWTFSNFIFKQEEGENILDEILGFDWKYNPGSGDPQITAFTVKYGNQYDVYKLGAGQDPTMGSFLLSDSGNALSHITFFDTAKPIPTPALLPGLVGMGVAAMRKRKQTPDEVSDA